MAGKTAPETSVFLFSNVCIGHHNRHVHVMFNITEEITFGLFVNRRHAVKRDPPHDYWGITV